MDDLPEPLEQALALIAEGQAGEAVITLRALIDAGRGGLLARLALSRALAAAGDVGEAMAEAREAVLLNPRMAIAALGLGEAMLAANMLPTAIAEFQRALRLDENLTVAHYYLGCAWLEAGEPDRALEHFGLVPADDMPGDMTAKIAEAEAIRVRMRSDPRYLRHLFDQFSTDYDARMLGPLRYNGHTIVRELANLVLGMPRNDLVILDLGCGTGLGGLAFWDLASRIDGVDISPAMIAKAGERGVYEMLTTGDIETLLNEDGFDYDLMIAADTLVYLGDLSALLPGVAKRLVPGGYFLFTTEKKEGDGFELGPKRRWRHSENYLRETANAAGLNMAGLVACTPRFEANIPVAGLAVALAKPA